MTTPQGPRNDGPSNWARQGDQGPLGRPAHPADPSAGRLHPGDPRGGRGQQPPAAPPPQSDHWAAANADARRVPHTPPTTPGADRTTPVAKPQDQAAETKKKKRSRRDPLSILLVLVIVFALVVAGLVGVELFIRNKANNKIATATACKVEDKATASFGVTPLVTWQVITDHYTNITVETAGNQIRSAKGMKLQLNLRDVKVNSTAESKGTIGAIDATITWTAQGIKETVQNSIPVVGDFVTSSVTTHPKDQTVELKGMLNDIVAKPTIVNGALELQIVSFNALGFKLPKETVQSSLDDYTRDLSKKLPLGIHAEGVEVTDGAVVIHFSSRNANIPAGETDPCFADL